MQLDRRQFTAAALAGAFSLGWRLPAQAQTGAAEIGIWAVVHQDDSIVVRIARSEMGQGTSTGLAQLVADEMDADWKFVRLEFVAPHDNFARKRAWGDMSTGGSRGLRGSVDYVRKGGAAARSMLMQAAAARWGVPAADCTASASVITHTPSGRTLRFGEVAAAAAKLPVPAEVTLKTPAQWTIIGKSVKRLDTLPKVSGKLQYALDVSVPGMLNAAIAQSPVFGGKLVSFDAKAIAGMSGVRHVLAIADNAVAVVADKFYQAKTALAKLPIVWDERGNGNVDSAAIALFVAEGLSAPTAGTGLKQGDAAGAIAAAPRKIEAVYGTPFLAHATMEPMNCTALYTGDAVEVWVATQNGEGALAAASEAASVPLAKVKVHKTTLGGGFGRRGNQDYTRYAVLLAKQLPGVPVKLIWTREEDTQHDFYRPITQCRLTAGLDAAGNLAGFHMRISGQSIMAFASPGSLQNGVDPRMFQSANGEEFGYHAIPDLLIEHAMRNTHVPVGPWRGVNTNQNAVYIECFIDELAHAAGKDPVAFRRPLMAKNPKNLAVLEAVAAKAGWGKPLPPGVFRGIAQNHGYGSYVACVAEVSVSPKGELKIHRLVAGTNPGHAVNPQLIDAQVDGSFAYGLSALLYSEITIAKGRVAEGNFDTYQVARMADMPKVETVVVPTGDFWGGVGEPTIAVAAPAVLNAIFAATNRRIRHLPLKDQDLRPA